jgi:hypothetical protein
MQQAACLLRSEDYLRAIQAVHPGVSSVTVLDKPDLVIDYAGTPVPWPTKRGLAAQAGHPLLHIRPEQVGGVLSDPGGGGVGRAWLAR